jgi:hypothetical protein
LLIKTVKKLNIILKMADNVAGKSRSGLKQTAEIEQWEIS